MFSIFLRTKWVLVIVQLFLTKESPLYWSSLLHLLEQLPTNYKLPLQKCSHEKLDELKILISEISSKIICLRETNFINLNTAKLSNYSGFSKHRTTGFRASGGIPLALNDLYVKSIYSTKEISISIHVKVIATVVNSMISK